MDRKTETKLVKPWTPAGTLMAGEDLTDFWKGEVDLEGADCFWPKGWKHMSRIICIRSSDHELLTTYDTNLYMINTLEFTLQR